MHEKIELAKKQIEEKLKDHPNRLKHVYGVAETAKELAHVYGVDEDKMMLAGLYHDFAKYDSYDGNYLNDEEKAIVKKFPVMFHAYQAAYLIQKNLGIDDQDIINSIKCHVWGKPKMTIYEKILFISDYCEPNRRFLDTKEILDMAKQNLNYTVKHCMLISINDLLNRNLEPSDLQLEAYKYYLEETRE